MPARTASRADASPKVAAEELRRVSLKLVWTAYEVGLMCGRSESYINQHRDADGWVTIDGGARFRMFKDPGNGQWVAYKAQIELALADHGLTTVVWP